HILTFGHVELLPDGRIEVEEARRAQSTHSGSPQRTHSGDTKCARTVVDSGCTEARRSNRPEELIHRLRCNHKWSVRVGANIAARSSAASVCRTRVRGHRKSRVRGCEEIDVPAAGDQVHWSVPIRPKLAFVA